MRFPMTTKYYQWLFDGTLGFTRAVAPPVGLVVALPAPQRMEVAFSDGRTLDVTIPKGAAEGQTLRLKFSVTAKGERSPRLYAAYLRS